jgi:ankyrin repeat protein
MAASDTNGEEDEAAAQKRRNREANRAAIKKMRAEEAAARGKGQSGGSAAKKSKGSTGRASNIEGDLDRAAEALRAKSKAGDFQGVRSVLKATQKEWGKRAIATIINRGDDAGRTALYWAAFKGASTILDGLVRMGAKVDTQLPSDGSTAAHIAAFNGHVDALRSLFSAGGVAALDTPRKNGWTPLFEAVEHSHGEAVTFLLESGVDPCAATPNGRTPCFVAAQEANVLMIELMLEAVAANGAALSLVAAALEGGSAGDADSAAAAAVAASEEDAAAPADGAVGGAAVATAGAIADAADAAASAGGGAAAAMQAAQLRMVSTIDHHGFSPLFAAVAWGESKALKTLVDAGATVFMPDAAEEGGADALKVAVQRWVIPVVELSNDQKTGELNLLRQAQLPFRLVAAAAAEETRLTHQGKMVMQGYAMMDGPPPEA